MSVDVAESFRNGVDELLSPRGVVVGGSLLVYAIVNLFVQQSIQLHIQRVLFRAILPAEIQDQALAQVGSNLPFAIETAIPVLLALALVMLLFNELLRLVSIRLFASDSADPLPFDDVTRNFGDAVPKALIVGGLFALVHTSVNFVPLLGQVIGWILVLVFVFLRQVIALENEGYVDTVSESLEAFMEDPLPLAIVLFVLGFGGFVVNAGISLVLSFVVFPSAPEATVAGQDPQVISGLITVVFSTLFQALGIAVVTDAYLQVRADRDKEETTAV